MVKSEEGLLNELWKDLKDPRKRLIMWKEPQRVRLLVMILFLLGKGRWLTSGRGCKVVHRYLLIIHWIECIRTYILLYNISYVTIWILSLSKMKTMNTLTLTGTITILIISLAFWTHYGSVKLRLWEGYPFNPLREKLAAMDFRISEGSKRQNSFIFP